MALAVANDSGWQAYYNWFGPMSVSPSNAAGNLLVLFATWNTNYVGSTSQPVPASAVADSSRNWWRLGSDTGNLQTASWTGILPGSRCAIWFCHNALAVRNWLSFSLLGYASSVLWKLVEFSGLPANYYPVIDFGPYSLDGGVVSSISPFVNVVTQPDYVFAVMGIGSTAPVITNPAAPWTTLGANGVVGGVNPNGCESSAAYATVSAGALPTLTWSFTLGTSYASGCALGLSQANSGPVQISPNQPNFQTALALGATPGDPSQAILDNAWTDVSPRTYGPHKAQIITAGRGRQYELSQPEAGLLTVAFSNIDGAFNPNNQASPYYSNALNANMSFQTGIWDWNAGGGAAISQSSAQAQASAPGVTSKYSLLLTPNGTTTNPSITCGQIPVNKNYIYSISAFLWVTGGWSNVQISANWYDATHTFINSTTSPAIPAVSNGWDQLDWMILTPPTSAAFMSATIQLTGTPASSVLTYVSEAGIALGSSPLSTGLVRQGCPVRELAYWQGRNYPAAYGYVERWPQDWPDGLAQWGFSTMVATDSAGVAASTNLPSAVQGEILADGAYVCLPFSEQYTTSTSTLNGTTKVTSPCSGLIAVNTSRINQKTGVYHDGGNGLVATGQAMGLLGDAGTGMGTTAYSTMDITSHFRGPGVVYGPDYGLPSSGGNGFTFEMWLIVPKPSTTTTLQNWQLQMAQIYTQPYISSNAGGTGMPGSLFGLGIYWLDPTSANNPQAAFFQTGSVQTGPSVAWGSLNHFVVTCQGGTATWWLNGVQQGSNAGLVQQQLVAATFGESGFSYAWWGSLVPNVNYSLAYGAIYPYVMSGNRIAQHYASGINGFTGDNVTTRMGRYLAWAGTGLASAGPGSIRDDMKLAQAYSTAGSPLSGALNADAMSSGARWFSDPSGNIVMLPRPAQYNRPVTLAFGDNVIAGEIPFVPTMGFDYDNSYVSGIVQATLQQGPNTLIAPVEKDQTSITQYFPRGPLSQQVSGSSLQDAFDRAYWSLNKYKQPSMRVRAMSVDLATRPSAVTQVLQSGIADGATVSRRPLGGAAYSLPVTIEKMSLSVGPGLFKMDYQMSPYVPEDAVLVADTAGFDVLGNNALGW